jgi:hypothetical protein
VKSFFQGIVGEWIGTCEQSTDGEQADNKYFRAVVKQVDANSFTTNFDYYKYDEKAEAPVQIGSSSITTTIAPDGSAKNKITGKGTMLVDYKPKQQKHDLQEVISSTPSGLRGQGTGTLSVSGMPLGLGKNGKIQQANSTWTFSKGVLSIRQDIKAGFRALFINKSFYVKANYTAQRGSDVVSLMTGRTRVSSKPGTGAGPM